MKKRLGKKSRFPLEINEIPNEGGRFATVIMPFKYTGKKICCSLRAFSYGKKIEIFC